MHTPHELCSRFVHFYALMWFVSRRFYTYTPHRCLTWEWWRHQMETFSALLAICAGNSPAPGEFPVQRLVTRSFDVFFDLRLNKRFSKQSWAYDLRRYRAHYDVIVMGNQCQRSKPEGYTELETSCWRIFHLMLHRKLPFWQLAVLTVTTMSVYIYFFWDTVHVTCKQCHGVASHTQ